MTVALRPVRQSGFTLIELLIALAITTTVVALVFAGFGLIGRTEERNQRLIDRAERMAVTVRWLGGKFDTLRLLQMQQGSGFVSFFSGNAAGAMWIAPLPERGDAGGLYVLRATPLRHGDGRVDLAVEVLPYGGALMVLDWGRAERAVLLPDIRTLQWHYQNAVDGQWTQQWDPSKGGYPVRVKVELADAQGAWPALVFSLARAR